MGAGQSGVRRRGPLLPRLLEIDLIYARLLSDSLNKFFRRSVAGSSLNAPCFNTIQQIASGGENLI